MLDNGRISSVQLLFIFLILEGSSAILYAPARVAALAGADSWLAVTLPSALYGLLVLLVAVTLGKRFPAQVFTEYLPEIVGKVLGKLLATAYVLMFIHLASLLLNEGSTFINIAYLSQTPPVVLDGVMAVMAVYGAYLGIEAIARENGMVMPMWIVVFMLLVSLAAVNLNFSNFKPVLENGLLPVLRAGAFHSAWRGEIFVMLMLYPYLNRKQQALKTGLVYLGVMMILAGSVHGVIVGVFGGPVTAHMLFPFDELAQYISIGNFMERMEIVSVVFLVMAVIIKLAVVYHTAGVAAASTLGLKNYRVTLVPIALATAVLSRVLYGNYLKLLNGLYYLWPSEGLIVELAIPVLILLIAVLRKKGGASVASK
jgi:spore germination protein KB